MGMASWVIAGIAVFGFSRMLRLAPLHWAIELPVAILTALCAGLVATAADFGGWSEPDPRAFAFCLLIALCAMPLLRLLRLSARRRQQS